MDVDLAGDFNIIASKSVITAENDVNTPDLSPAKPQKPLAAEANITHNFFPRPLTPPGMRLFRRRLERREKNILSIGKDNISETVASSDDSSGGSHN